VELCRWLHERGAEVSAYDPSAEVLPTELGFIQRSGDFRGALKKADAAVIGTACEEFKSLTESDMIESMPHPIVIDAGGYLERALSNCDRIRYFSVGRTHGTLDTNR